MPSPISIIGYLKTGESEVQFNSLSVNVDEDSTYLWDFGDGNTSTEENPLHTFLTQAYFTVTLTVTNLDTTTSESGVLLNLTSTPIPTMFTNIPGIVDLYSPTQVIGSIKNNQQKDFFISKWQAYLQPLASNPEVEAINTFNPSAYNPLVNSLIARLVVIDIITAEAAAFAINTAVEGQSPSTSTEVSGAVTSTLGGIKSIETGPTKVERYENKDNSSNSEKISNLAKAYQQLIVKDGVVDELKRLTCQEAQRVDIFLPMCGPLPANNKGFNVSKRDSSLSSYNSNPFGITDRML